MDSPRAPELELFRGISTDELRDSLAPGHQGCLKVRPDGTVLMAITGLRCWLSAGRTFISSPARQ